MSVATKVITAALAFALLPAPAQAAPALVTIPGEAVRSVLPAPPRPLTNPSTTSPRIAKRTSSPGVVSTVAGEPKTAGTNGRGAPGANTSRRTLVLYDTTGPSAWLGEAYAVLASNLVSHGSPYVMHPVSSYTAGELSGYTGVIYVGSTYDEPVPAAFLDDVLAGSRPVLWMAHNIWQLSARAPDFAAQYGWRWTGYDFGAATTVRYKDTDLARDPLATPSGLMVTSITDPAKATAVAVATGSPAGPINWATRSGNLTYVGEIPFSYVGYGDRYLAAADLISRVANPSTAGRRRALVRIEDVGPDSNPAELRAIADYLHAEHIPFSIATYPRYENPLGVGNNGVAAKATLAQRPLVVDALRYLRERGGTIIMHGYTHQFGEMRNPYDGRSGNDFEFYRAHVDEHDDVSYDGPVPGDSASWAQGRIDSASKAFALAGFARPAIFEPPHYAASAVDYEVIQQNFGKRYDRGLYFGGYCPGGACGTGTPDYGKTYGQYFPYLVRDIYGSVVVPESVGNVALQAYNNHPVRLPADVIKAAQQLKVVDDGVASFFYHPFLGTGYLRQTVEGLRSAGYTFVSAAAVTAG